MKLSLMSLVLTASLVVALPNQARAYFVASLSGPQVLDTSKPTHVLVSGRGQNLGRGPQLSALGIAARIRQVDPTAQVVLISVFEDAGNRQALEEKGASIQKVNEAVAFNTASAMPELLKFTQISSLHFFGHNSPTLGTQTDGPGERFDFREKKVAALKGHFTNDSFVFVHGGNAGWLIAPLLSRIWGVPAAGAFTGTQFERLHEDGQFYVASSTGAPTLSWAKQNGVSLDNLRSCSGGGCMRMKPTNAPYRGHWGDLGGGALGFYKFFCVTNTQSACERVMAKSLVLSLTPENVLSSHSSPADQRETYIKTAIDFVCPPSKDRELSNACASAMRSSLDGGTRTYTSLRTAPTLQCDFKSCQIKFVCTTTGGVAGIGSCSVERTSKAPPTTQVSEFLAYVRGFDQIAANR